MRKLPRPIERDGGRKRDEDLNELRILECEYMHYVYNPSIYVRVMCIYTCVYFVNVSI